MNKLLNWVGKQPGQEEVSLSYDVLGTSPLLLTGIAGGCTVSPDKEAAPANDFTSVEWDHSINKADKTDYEIAVCCGILSGLLDSFFVEDFSLESANTWGKGIVNQFVIKTAELDGFAANSSNDKDILQKSIRYLENKHSMATDKVTDIYGGSLQHHFRDFSHHLSIGGLLCSVYTQFSENAIGTDTNGELLIHEISDKTCIGKNTHDKILFGTIGWVFHMASDMAGSSMSPGVGTGIPGPLLSFIKELSVLPFFANKKIGDIGFRKWLSKLFNGTLLAKHDENNKIIKDTQLHFDLRTEIGIVNQIGLQLLPVILNECLVRGMYFIRRTYIEFKDLEIHNIKDLSKIDPSDVLPKNNRVVLRMLTVASGVFTVIDVADAGARALIANKGNVKDPNFVFDFVVKLNFTNIGRFVIACCVDSKSAFEESQQSKKRKDAFSSKYGQRLSELHYHTYSLEEIRLYYSLVNQLLQYDIKSTKHEKAMTYKKEWLDIWKSNILSGLPVIKSEKESFFYSDDDLYANLGKANRENDASIMYNLSLDLLFFQAYYAIGSEHDEKYENLKLESNYLEDVFSNHQSVITLDTITQYKKAITKYNHYLTGNSRNKVVGAIETVTLAAATGSLALIAAPAVAPAIAAAFFGEAIAGLSGAALTSASLAALGGGALAAGGLGMAGGTAIISGGGVLLGILGGTGISSLASIAAFSNETIVLDECVKALVYAKVVLFNIYHSVADITTMSSGVNSKINEINDQLTTLNDNDKISKEQKKAMASICRKSIKYLDKCNIELQNMLQHM